MIVIDASALVEALLGMPASEQVEEWLFGSREAVHAPHLIDAEIAQVVRRYASRGYISAETGHSAMIDLMDLQLLRHRHDFLLPRVWELRNNLTAYDAVYVALAEVLDAPLITRDRRIAGAAGHHAEVRLI